MNRSQARFEHHGPADHARRIRLPRRADGVVEHGPVGRLRGRAQPTDRLLRPEQRVQPHNAERRHPQRLGPRPQDGLRGRDQQERGHRFVGTSITSSLPGVSIPVVEGSRPDNPHTKFFDGANRGYTRCDLNRQRYLTTFKAIPTEPGQGSVGTPEAESTTLAAFVVENGQPGATRVQGQTTPTSSSQLENRPRLPAFDGQRELVAEGAGCRSFVLLQPARTVANR
jgi:hypothetical protein